MCQISIFSLERFQRYKGPNFSRFSNMAVSLCDVIIIIKIFCMSSHTYAENILSIREAVAEKNMKVLCGQTNRQTDKQMNEPMSPLG